MKVLVVDDSAIMRTVIRRAIEEHGADRDIEISAVTDRERIFEAAKAGVNEYVEKPIKGVELWQRISEYLSRA